MDTFGLVDLVFYTGRTYKIRRQMIMEATPPGHIASLVEIVLSDNIFQ